jgi:hypothetical protein
VIIWLYILNAEQGKNVEEKKVVRKKAVKNLAKILKICVLFLNMHILINVKAD